MSFIKKILEFFNKNEKNIDIDNDGNLQMEKYIGKFVNQGGVDIERKYCRR